MNVCQVTKDSDRTKLMAWYNLFGCLASAMGALTCGFVLTVLSGTGGLGLAALKADRITMTVYALLQIALAVTFSQLGPDVEVPFEV